MGAVTSIPDDPMMYDVFINAGGTAASKFTTLLYRALEEAGIHPFKVNENLHGGEISTFLIHADAIQGSRSYVVIFSPDYITSHRCLEELAKIMDCKRAGQSLLPVFYGVSPFNFLTRSATFMEAFIEHEERFGVEKVTRWREALIGAAHLNGLNSNSSDDVVIIKQIVHWISYELNSRSLSNFVKIPIVLNTYKPNDYPTRSPESEKHTYDVFVSYRVLDTRRKFYSHLRDALTNSGIKMFFDEGGHLGEEFLKELLQTIHNSRIFVTILSKNYASSIWCLDELVEMIDLVKKTGRIILPVFYHVDPLDVRDVRGSFAEAFAKHEQQPIEKEKVCRWRTTFAEVGCLSGWEVRDSTDGGNEQGTIVEIVNRIALELKLSEQEPTDFMMVGQTGA